MLLDERDYKFKNLDVANQRLAHRLDKEKLRTPPVTMVWDWSGILTLRVGDHLSS